MLIRNRSIAGNGFTCYIAGAMLYVFESSLLHCSVHVSRKLDFGAQPEYELRFQGDAGIPSGILFAASNSNPNLGPTLKIHSL